MVRLWRRDHRTAKTQGTMRGHVLAFCVTLFGTVSCDTDERSARDRRNAPPIAERWRSVHLASPKPPVVETHGGFEYRVSVTDTAEQGGRAVRVRIRVQTTSGDSARFAVDACSQDLRLYRIQRERATLAYSWRRGRLCAEAGSLYFLDADDTLLFRPMLRGYDIGDDVRGGQYELRATLPGVRPIREVGIGLVRLEKPLR